VHQAAVRATLTIITIACSFRSQPGFEGAKEFFGTVGGAGAPLRSTESAGAAVGAARI
jgi:hypothetical protein